MLAIGALGIYLTVSDDPVNLPSEGTIQDLVGDDTTAPSVPSEETAAPSAGPLGPPPPPSRLVIPSLYIDAPMLFPKSRTVRIRLPGIPPCQSIRPSVPIQGGQATPFSQGMLTGRLQAGHRFPVFSTGSAR
jgi:hypothetical protein